MKKKFLFLLFLLSLAGSGLYLIRRDKGAVESVAISKTGTKINDIAPSFTITTVEGKEIKSSSLRGKIVVITSAAAWCPTCVKEAQEFAPVYQKYKDKGVVFITVDIDPRDDKDFIQQFQITNKTPWHYTDAEGGKEIREKYSLQRFEITYILDRQGKIRFKDSVITRGHRLEQEIEKLLSSPAN